MNKEEALIALYEKLKPLSKDCWDSMTSLLYTKTLKGNEFFCKEGGRVKELAYVASGVVRIFFIDEEGNEWIKRFVLKDDLL